METVAYVIVTWNNAEIIARCVDSILSQVGVTPEIFVLDNASADSTAEVVRAYPEVHLIESTKNHGYAKGNNILIHKALEDTSAKWVALINSDATLDPAWTQSLLEFALPRTNLAAVQGLTLDYYNHEIVDSEHIFVSGRLQGIQYGYGSPAEMASYYPRKVFGVNTAAAMYSREFIQAHIDPDSFFFDERFYMYYEDVDVAYRALVAGFDAYFVPSAVAYHMGSVSAKKRKQAYSQSMVARNQMAMVFKNTPRKVLLRSLPGLVVGMIAFLTQVRHEFSLRQALAVMRSFAVGIALLPRYARSRHFIRKATAIDGDYLTVIMNSDGVRG